MGATLGESPIDPRMMKVMSPSSVPSSREPHTSLFGDPKRLISTVLPMVIGGGAGLIVFIDSISGESLIAPVAFALVDWTATLTALALLVGLLSVTASHIRRVQARHADWQYSLILLLAMAMVMVVGITGFPGLTVSFPQNLAEQPIRRFFHAVYEPLTSSLLALLAFFSLSAILRAFQRRRVEVIVITGIAFVVLVVQLPPVASLPMLSEVFEWINQYIALAGARGLLIGTAIGTLVTCIRILLGFDQPYLDR